MLFNEILFIESALLMSILFYTTNTNLLSLLYTAAIYLIFLGILLFINDADIYVGFLWVIDLGVGLVFFIFILHFTAFLHQKSQFNLTSRFFFLIATFYLFIITLIYYIPNSNDNCVYRDLGKTWFFRLSNIDYYVIQNTYEVTELNLLRDSYFVLNSFEFFLVNFSLIFGLLASILMCFLIQRIFNVLNFSQIHNTNLLNNISSGFFIKSQNFITQQNTAGVVKVWVKSKSYNIQ